MNRKISYIILLACLFFGVYYAGAQHFLVNSNNAQFNVSAGAYVRVPGTVVNNTNSVINNNGNIFLSGDFVNNAYVSSGTGSNVKLEGATQDVGGTNSTTFENLIIDGINNKTISINTFINNTLLFNANHVIIGNNNLVLLSNAGISGAFNNKYVVTNLTGWLVKKSLPTSGNFLFPVGNALLSYKPVVLNYTGVTDTFSVRVEAGLDPTTGVDPTCVQYTYFVEESNNGGTNATMSLGWNSNDEGSAFDRTKSLMWQYIYGAWTSLAGTPGASLNLPATNWYYQTSGITDFSSNANKFIVRTPAGPGEIFLPDAFSPNGDNQNDVLYVRGFGIKDLHLIIYDRWGEKIFESTSQKNGWDGTFHGNKLDPAVFVYYLEATFYDDTKVIKKGNITLVK